MARLEGGWTTPGRHPDVQERCETAYLRPWGATFRYFELSAKIAVGQLDNRFEPTLVQTTSGTFVAMSDERNAS